MTAPTIETVKIPLTGRYGEGRFAIIDAADAGLVEAYSPQWRGALGSTGWVYAAASKDSLFLHNLLMGTTGIDHVNGDGLDNRRANLRVATRVQNAANNRKRAGTNSRYKGVNYRCDSGKWQARIGGNGGTSLGMYATEEEAARAYDEAACERWGEFAALNFPRPGEQTCHRVPTIIAQAQDGDMDAFAEIYSANRGHVFRYVLSRVSNRATADDLTSEVFVRALRNFNNFTYQGKDVNAWLTRIAHNLVIDLYRSGRNRYEVSTGDDWALDSQDVDAGPEATAVSRAFRSDLAAIVQRLTPEQRDVIMLRFFGDLNTVETAAALNRSVPSVVSLTHRAVHALAALIPPEAR